VARNDGTAEPYAETVFTRDVLTRRASEARLRAERLRAFAAPGGLGSVDLARVVDAQSQLPSSDNRESALSDA
jgi:hypothetical protein